MGLLDSFEKGIERAVNGAFAKTFRSGIQPVEIASALRAELDTKAAVVSRDRILAPNTLEVSLAPADERRMAQLGATLQNELNEIVRTHAKKQGYSFAGPIVITLRADDRQPTGTLSVTSETAQAEAVTWQAVVDIDGQRHPLTKARTVIGRGSDADITIADPNTSRKHVEILWDGARGMMRDLGSTNGSKLNGVKSASGRLEPDAQISIGRTTIVFRVIPVSARQRAPRPKAPDMSALFDAREHDH